MKQITHFNLPAHDNSVYENEAISSISLAKEVADKINELVDALNTLYSGNLEWQQEQQGRISKGVLYMKDNLINSLNDLMEILKAEGFIDDRIEYHCDYLKERLNNLLTADVVDGELIDGRVSYKGSVYDTIGDAIRTELSLLRDYVSSALPVKQLELGEITVGYIDSNGNNYASSVTLRTKNFLDLKGTQLFLINPDPERYIIRIFRYSKNNVFEKEYDNAGFYRLDAGKHYKMSFTYSNQKDVTVQDIHRFNLLHYKETPELTPEMFGGKANDKLFDNEPAFYLMIEYAKSVAPLVDFEGRPVYDFRGLTFKFNGTYYISNAIMFPDMLNGVFDGLRLKFIGDVDGYLLNLGYSRDCRFTNMILDGNYKTSCILLRDGYSNLSIKDSVICHFTWYGIRTGGHGGHELNIVGNKIFQTEYQNFETMRKTNKNGCAIMLTEGHTDNLIADNIICYTFGERQIQINSGSLMFHNNHLYNAGHGEVFVYGTNHVYSGNFFDCITVNDARGGNLFTGNTFVTTKTYLCTLMKFTTTNYFGRKTVFNNNLLKAPKGFLYSGVDGNTVVTGNIETEV